MESTNNDKSIEVFKIPENWKNKSNKIRSMFYNIREADWKFERGYESEFLKNLNSGLNNNNK